MTDSSWFEVASLAQTIVMGIAMLLSVLLLRGFKVGRWTAQVDGSKAALERQITDLAAEELRHHTELSNRMDRAGKKMSDFATDIQGLETRLRSEFVLRAEDAARREAAAIMRTEMRAELDSMWAQIRELQRGA